MSVVDDRPGFRPIPNPYITGNPVRGREVFFGREDDFAYARQRLMAEKNGIVLLFVGARRSGKTSIMFQILEGRLGQEFLPVFVDMQRMAGVQGDREYYGRIAGLVVEGVDDQRLVLDYYDFKEGNPVISFDRLLNDIQSLYPTRRLVLLVDEAEILHTMVGQGQLSSAVLTYMASILESRRVSFCFTGSPGLSQMQEDEWRRLTGKGDYREISFLSRDDTARLVREPVEGYVIFDDGVAEAIYALTYGQPFYTQVICTYAVDFLNSNQRNRLTLEDLAEVTRTLVDNPPPQLIYEWDNLPRTEQLVLSLLSEVSAAPGHGIRAAELAKAIRDNDYPLALREDLIHVALESLFNRKWLERDDVGAYCIRVDLFRQWIRRARSIWRMVEDTAPRTQRRLWVGAGVLAAVALVGLGVGLRSCRDGVNSQQPAASMAALPATGWLYVRCRPPDAEVWLDGSRCPQGTGTNIPGIRAGEHWLRLVRPGYRTDSLKVVVLADSILEVPAVMLERIRGVLRLEVTPGARVDLNLPGDSAADRWDTSVIAPSAPVRVPTGMYQATATLEDCLPFQGGLTVAERDTALLRVDLKSAVGTIIVDSDPRGASILLDRQPTGKVTPDSITRLEAREHSIGLRLTNHVDVDTPVTVARGLHANLRVLLTLMPATLDLKTTPPGARIYLDGASTPEGVTPKELHVESREHAVRFELDGYESREARSSPAPGKSETINVPLTQLTGLVRIARPLAGRVIVDGLKELEFGEGEGDLTLSVGHHELELKATGEKKSTDVAHDSTSTVKFSATKE